MRRFIAAIALVAGLSACTPVQVSRAISLLKVPVSHCVARPGRVCEQKKHRCQEDDPCWNCHTMGNHICGRKRAAK